MKVQELPNIFKDAVPLINTLHSAGFNAYFVGGAVRDLLLDRHIHDVDIATNAYPAEVKKLFKTTIDTGIQHGTVTVKGTDNYYEVTTFRTESTYQDFRRPDHVEFVQSLSDDLKRRDFTINALAMDVSGEIIDIFGGLADLENGLIKAVGKAEERFHEDALRMMRAVRFVSQLGFDLDRNTKEAIATNRGLLQKIAVERIREEFVKLGMGKDSKRGIDALVSTGLAGEMPLFSDKVDLLKNYQTLTTLPINESMFWSVIIILTKISNENIVEFLREWKNSKEIIHQVTRIIECFDMIISQEISNYQLFDFGLTTITSAIDLAAILGEPVNGLVLIDRYNNLPIKHNSELAIDGKFLISELAIKPGPEIGRILALVLQGVLDDKLKNNQENIKKYVQQITSVL